MSAEITQPQAPAGGGVWREVTSGWAVIAAAFLPVGLHALPNYGFSALIGPMAEDFGVEVSRIALWTLFWSFGAILCSVFAGRVVDRWGPRSVILILLPVYALVLSGMAMFSVNMAVLFAFAFLTGIACTGIGSIPSGRLIADRFDAGLGTAFGLMAAGIGLAALLGPVLLQQVTDRFGWRAGYLCIAVLALLAWPVFYGLTRRQAADAPRAARPPEQVSVSHLIRSRTFLLMAAGTFLFGMVVTGATVNMILFLGSHGLERAEAAGFAGLFGISTIAGRMLTGLALDRIPLHIAEFTAIVLTGLAACLALMSADSLAIVLLMVGLFGFAVGAEADCLSYSVVRLFGRKVYGQMYGFLGVGALLTGSGFGPLIFNSIFETTGNYAGTLRIWSMVALLSAFLFLLVRKDPYTEVKSQT